MRPTAPTGTSSATDPSCSGHRARPAGPDWLLVSVSVPTPWPSGFHRKVGENIPMEGLDEAVGFVALGVVRPDDEPIDTDPLVGLDDLERELARGGHGDLEWSQHWRSRLGLYEVLQVLDQFASPLGRGESAEPSIADPSHSGSAPGE